MKWKEIVTDYLTFTRKEQIGIITVLLILLISIFLPNFYSHHDGTSREIPDTTWMVAVRKLEQKQAGNEKNISNENEGNLTAYQYDRSKPNYYNNKPGGELFYFDPNSLSKSGWQKLGLRDKTIGIIQNYLAKGGHFKKPEDLQRIYGLHKDDYDRLAPYVKIETQSAENKNNAFSGTRKFSENKVDSWKALRYASIDINVADTADFINLPGIGSKLATRIVNFREKLGGFYTIEQVRETFGLPDSTFQKVKQYLKLENSSIRKININTANIDELKAHPYIRYNIANPIVAYRNEHGSFSSIEDLKKIMIITDEVYQKIAPYLTLAF
jgi:competence protein ComEA